MIIYDMKTEDLINQSELMKETAIFFANCNRKTAVLFKTAYRIIVRSDNDTVWDSGKRYV